MRFTSAEPYISRLRSGGHRGAVARRSDRLLALYRRDDHTYRCWHDWTEWHGCDGGRIRRTRARCHRGRTGWQFHARSHCHQHALRTVATVHYQPTWWVNSCLSMISLLFPRLRQRKRYMFLPVFVGLFVSLLTTLLKNAWMDLNKMLRVDNVGTCTNWLTFQPDPDLT